MARRIVQKIKPPNEQFIETSFKEWPLTLEKALVDNGPWPAPRGHQMFKYPSDYGCKEITSGN